MLEVLIFMYQNYLGKQASVQNFLIEEHNVAKELSQAGFEYNDILGAFDWYRELSVLIDQPYHQYIKSPHALRIYTEQERERIDTESLGFIGFLEQASIIMPNERELIIDRAMALKQETITIEEIRWITMMVLWDDKRKKDYLFIEDAVFNPKGLTLQ